MLINSYINWININNKYSFKHYITQSRIIGAVRGTYSQLWVTTLPVFSPYAPRIIPLLLTERSKYDKRFGQLSDLQGEIKPTYRASDLQEERIFIRRT